MTESQEEVDLRYYSRWEIAAAREQTAQGCAFIAAFFAAIAADLKWGWWLWTACSFVVAYLACTYEYAANTKRAWLDYEGRPVRRSENDND